ncbi:MAG: transporter substrate-binding domain-containing protein, partial [Pseudomonadota bacterium]
MARLLIVLALMFTASTARAQEPVIPNFFDPGARLVRPDLSDRPRLRFLTVTDFPPFSFIDRRKRLTGLHVDLAREICAVLRLLERCQIQALPFAELEGALRAGDGEAILAGLPPTVERRRTLGFTSPYFRLPSRFVVKAGDALATADDAPLITRLAGKEVGIVDGSAQAAFAQTYFEDARL